jgi:ribonuclease P protein component
VAEPGSGVAVAFSIGRKVAGAVVRNRLRRQLRSLFDGLDPLPGNYLVRIYFQSEPPTYDELQQHLVAALSRARALHLGGPGPQ